MEFKDLPHHEQERIRVILEMRRQETEGEEHEKRQRLERAAADSAARSGERLRKIQASRAEAEKAEAERRELELEELLAPHRERHQRQWMAEHPGFTLSDWERAWKLMRSDVVEEVKRNQAEAERAAVRASGAYYA